MERGERAIIVLICFFFRIFMVREGDTLTRKYLKDDNMPYLGDLIDETGLMLVNTHYSLSGSKPLSPSVIEIGGVHIQEPKPLEEVGETHDFFSATAVLTFCLLTGFAKILGFS